MKCYIVARNYKTCILTASSARSFWLENILNSNDYDKDEKELEDSDVIFLPYLCGERSPHNDVDIRGAFIGLSINTTRGQMSKAIMEGVAFALKHCINTFLLMTLYCWLQQKQIRKKSLKNILHQSFLMRFKR